jgi:anti-sigma factor RsiW
MNCSKAHKLISPYIDGQLTELEMRTLDDHMNVCHMCRAELGEGKELHNLFANADNFNAPYGFRTRVMANITSGKIRGFSRFPVFVRLAEAVVVVVVIAFGMLSGSLMIKGYPQDKARDAIAWLSLDVFDSAPPDSLGGVYLAMTEVRNEK